MPISLQEALRVLEDPSCAVSVLSKPSNAPGGYWVVSHGLKFRCWPADIPVVAAKDWVAPEIKPLEEWNISTVYELFGMPPCLHELPPISFC